MQTFNQLYYASTGYSYTNLGRMFLRLFVGLMLMQFGLRELSMPHLESCNFLESPFCFPLAVVIIIEIICSFCIMVGFLTRFLSIPPFLLMIISAVRCMGNPVLMALPFMFMGIYFFIFLVGPGKISIDYYLSLYLINRNNDNEDDLEEV